MGTGKRRKPAQIARDRRRAADWYLQGRLQAEIAISLGLSGATVSRDLKTMQAQWLEEARADFSEAKARELAKIDQVEREHWEGWRRSCLHSAAKRTEMDATSNVEKVITIVKAQAGDPRFLAGILKCIERRCKLLGLDAPDLLKADIVTTALSLDDWRALAKERRDDVNRNGGMGHQAERAYLDDGENLKLVG